MRLAGHRARRAPLGTALLLPPRDDRLAHLLGAAHRAHRRVEGAARGRPTRAYDAAQVDRVGRAELADREPGTEVVRDRVEPAGVHDPGAGGDRAVVVLEVHPVDELRLAGQVDVVGAGGGARRDQRLAVQQVGPDGGDHDAGGGGDGAQRLVVGAVGVQQRQVRERRVDRREAGADRLELGLVAPGQGPAEPGGGVLGEVGGGQLAGEAGGSEEDDVVVTAAGRGTGLLDRGVTTPSSPIATTVQPIRPCCVGTAMNSSRRRPDGALLALGVLAP